MNKVVMFNIFHRYINQAICYKSPLIIFILPTLYITLVLQCFYLNFLSIKHMCINKSINYVSVLNYYIYTVSIHLQNLK